jgi:hypothetical protein
MASLKFLYHPQVFHGMNRVGIRTARQPILTINRSFHIKALPFSKFYSQAGFFINLQFSKNFLETGYNIFFALSTKISGGKFGD